jgi:hypothetical protein
VCVCVGTSGPPDLGFPMSGALDGWVRYLGVDRLLNLSSIRFVVLEVAVEGFMGGIGGAAATGRYNGVRMEFEDTSSGKDLGLHINGLEYAQ